MVFTGWDRVGLTEGTVPSSFIRESEVEICMDQIFPKRAAPVQGQGGTYCSLKYIHLSGCGSAWHGFGYNTTKED